METVLWSYAVQDNELVAFDISSLSQLKELSQDKWVWIDVFDPDENELKILSELVGSTSGVVAKYSQFMGKPIDMHFDGCSLCDYERINGATLLTVPSLSLEEEMKIYPIFLAKMKKMVITWGEEKQSHSDIIKKTIKRLREGVEAGQVLDSSLVVSVLFHEIALRNSSQILSIKKRIDILEESALENGGKNIVRSIFSLKKIISNLYRLMVEEKDFILDVDKSVIPLVRLTERSKPIVGEAADIIDREIDFLDSYNRSLDNLLTLTDLASIHKVESSINYLTIILVISTAVLVFFELMAVLELA